MDNDTAADAGVAAAAAADAVSAPPTPVRPPPGVTVRPFRVTPLAAAAADTAAVTALFRAGMESVAAESPRHGGLDAEAAATLTAALGRFVERVVAGDLENIPEKYMLGGKGGADGKDPTSSSSPSSTDGRRGYFFLAVDAVSGEPLGCVGGKPPAVPNAPPTEGEDGGGENGDGGGNVNDGNGGSGAAAEGAESPAADDTVSAGQGGDEGAAIPPRPLSVELVRMAVAPSARRRGVGRALITALHTAAAADGIYRSHLSTFSVMVPAMRLYAAAGYRVVAMRDIARLYQTLNIPGSVVWMEMATGAGGGGEDVPKESSRDGK
ncbi:hypothetical protein MMPV_003596 [Pyropia vietnamensis]